MVDDLYQLNTIKGADMQEPREVKRAVYKGFTYKILDLGRHPTAYVEIPKGHILFNVGYGDIRIAVHGGLTYSGSEKGKGYWIGWDYAHFDDFYNMPEGMMSHVLKGKKWTVAEIEADCKSVIDQVLKIKKFRKNEYYYAVKESEY